MPWQTSLRSSSAARPAQPFPSFELEENRSNDDIDRNAKPPDDSPAEDVLDNSFLNLNAWSL